MKTFVLAIAGVVAVVSSTACGGSKVVVHGLDEFEANEIMVVLEARGISAEKLTEEGRVVSYAVGVSDVDAKDAMRLLVANHLPRERSETLDKVYPAGGGGLIPTKSEEKAKFMMALQGEIEHKLKTLPGIVSAHVTVVQPEKDIVRDLDTPPPLSTASVATVYNSIDPERPVASVTDDQIRALVAASVEDLKPSNVTVVQKQNKPTPLVDQFADSGQTVEGVAAATAYGMRFADKRSVKLATAYIFGLAALSIVGIAIAAGGIVRTATLRRRSQKMEAELTSMRKASRSTQTGLQQQA